MKFNVLILTGVKPNIIDWARASITAKGNNTSEDQLDRKDLVSGEESQVPNIE